MSTPPFGIRNVGNLKRIGHITPSSNTALEPITAMVNSTVVNQLSHHFTRIPVTHISLDESSLQQFETKTMTGAAELLADAPLSGILWNGTSGGWRGLEADRALERAVHNSTGLPFSTSTLAQLEVFVALDTRSYALAVPYREEVAERITATFESAGFQSASRACLGISTNTEFSEVPLENIRQLIRDADSPDAECVVIICTNFPAALVVDQMEQELGKPIYDSILVTFWMAMRMAGISAPIKGWGTLLNGSILKGH